MTLKEKARFFYQLAALLNSGMALAPSLNLAAGDSSAGVKKYWQQASEKVAAGESLAAALDRSYFDSGTLGLLRLAEYSGFLPAACQQIFVATEKQQRHQQLYRGIELAAIATIWSLLLVLVAIFKLETQAFLRPIFWLYAVGLGGSLWGLSRLAERYWFLGWGKVIAVIPGVAKAIEARSLLYLADMALPLSCGIPILTALDLTRQHIPDPEIAAKLARASRQLRAGKTLSQSLENQLPTLALQMIRMGEETGHLDRGIQQIATYYEGELERSLQQFRAILRPISLLAMGSVVAVAGIWLIKLLQNSLPS